ncbi:MAG: DNA mismatch endonuclease Vsr [Marinobacterium sp.]|nr:DNA mismatch endonuclease Vsr [Marinobacterium sp.]
MTDIVDKATRSRMMSGIQARNTRPERLLRSLLHRAGFRFRLHDKQLPGSPDLILPRYRTVIFVHGCYWHRHPRCKLAYTPKTRTEFWQQKFNGNVARDRRDTDALLQAGWRVVIVWECGLRAVAKGDKNLDWLIQELRDNPPTIVIRADVKEGVRATFSTGIRIEWPVLTGNSR